MNLTFYKVPSIYHKAEISLNVIDVFYSVN